MVSAQLFYESALKAKHCCRVRLWNSHGSFKEELHEFKLHEALTTVNMMI